MEKTDNELIAEFMGGAINTVNDGFTERRLVYFLPGNHPNPHCNAGTYKTPNDLEYHIRWDWLMPVVLQCREKFSDMKASEVKTILSYR